MPLDDLVTVIETLQGRIEKHGASLRENETRTRMALIDPLLQVLGWDNRRPWAGNPRIQRQRSEGRLRPVETAWTTGGNSGSQEVGRISESHRMQMLNYSNASGVEYAGLTDGNRWELYEVFERGPLEDRRILNITLAGTPAHQLALQFLLL